MKKIMVMIIMAIMACMLLVGCGTKVNRITWEDEYGNQVVQYYLIDGKKYSVEEYQIWRSEGFWR